MVTTACKICGKDATVGGSKPRVYCSLDCKAEHQRRAKPVTREWLVQKYSVDGLDATKIGKLVSRDPKSVWNWLKDFGIETRKRGHASTNKFEPGQRSAFAGMKHTPEARAKFREISLRDGRVPYLKNGVHAMKGRKGSAHPSWKGGLTPERQSFYSTEEWKRACVAVWRRDDAKCRRCGLDHRGLAKDQRGSFHVHHIVSFMIRELRADPGNLVLLCKACHRFIHGKNNTDRMFIKP